MSASQRRTVTWKDVPTRTITANGHGAVFQFHADFVPKALEFLSR
jgi:hypothetical protein